VFTLCCSAQIPDVKAKLGMDGKRFSIKVSLVLAVLGAALHFASLRWTVFPGFPTDASARVLDGPIVLSTYVLVAAILYGTLLASPVSQAVCKAQFSFLTVLKGGLFGMIATIVALQASYIAMGCVLIHLARTSYPAVRGLSIPSAFILSMLDPETYGLLVIIAAAIPAFLCGMLITGLARVFRHVRAPRSAS
jgi:hypothetical protein